MNNDQNLLDCYVSINHALPSAEQHVRDLAAEQGRLFRSYIWGDDGICDILKKLHHDDYGKDLKLALFQFYVNPPANLAERLKEIENYRKNEKSIGLPIVINTANFFDKPEAERHTFLRETIFQRLELLAAEIKRKKLDTNIEGIKADLQEILRKWT